MVLTRDFRSTILERAEKDARFREALFTEATNAYLAGDTGAGKAILRDLVNATIGFEGLAADINKPSKSLRSPEPIDTPSLSFICLPEGFVVFRIRWRLA
jgi:hypothetical protein